MELQRTKKWFEDRCGKLTASKFSNLIGKIITQSGRTYILEKIVEMTYGIKESFPNEAMQWGITHEAEAIDYYSLLSGDLVQEVGFVQSSEIASAGGSPDGLVGEEGLIEIKCPFTPVNHLKYGLMKSAADLKKLNKANYWQCMGNIMVTNRKWCDFISFDPRLEGESRMYILRIERDEKAIDELKEAIHRALEEKENLLTQLKMK